MEGQAIEGRSTCEEEMSVFENVYAIVRKIPQGKVMTYGQVADLVGTTAQVVGFALHANPYEGDVPCHRVVNRFGGLAQAFAFGGSNEQKLRLKMEGVAVNEEGVVPLEKFKVSTLDSTGLKAIF